MAKGREKRGITRDGDREETKNRQIYTVSGRMHTTVYIVIRECRPRDHKTMVYTRIYCCIPPAEDKKTIRKTSTV